MNNRINQFDSRVDDGDDIPLIVFTAGGKGTRIQSINSDVPKPMIPIAGKPILQWGIESLVKQGCSNFIITVSYLADSIIQYFGDGSSFGCSISYYNEIEPLGNAGALYKLWDEGRLTDTFGFFIADAVFDIDIHRLLSYHESNNAIATLFTHPNSHPFDSSIVVTDSDGIVKKWLNKEDNRPEWYKNCVNAGLQILTTELLEHSKISSDSVGLGKRQQNVDLDRDILKPLISSNRIFAYSSSEYCKDAGVPERFYAVERDIKEGRVSSKNLSLPQKAIFLDRDGTINKYVGFLRDSDNFELIRGVVEAIKWINDSAYLAIVVTNQPVIARGEISYSHLDEIHNKMETLLGVHGAYLDGIYVCPHHPDSGFKGEIKELKINCECRKPGPGLLIKAASDFNIELKESWMIGDSWRDIEAGKQAGCRTVLLMGDGTEAQSKACSPTFTVNDLFEGVKMIIEGCSDFKDD